MACALLSHNNEQITTLSSRISRPSSSDQPSHILKLREDLEALQRLVRRIQAVLADAEKREIHDESVKLWLRELSELAYDADDVLDEYNYEVHLRPQITTSDDSTWNKLAHRMGKIRLRFEEISCQRDALQLREGVDGVRQNVAVRSPSSHLPDAPTIFGREKIMEEVINVLLSPDGGEKHKLLILPIVGMGGVGKTTLVQHVYNDQRVCGRFQLRGWVCVSDDFAVDSLTKKIIESFTRQACQLNEFDAIQRNLIDVLNKKRFLIVLDDVWNEMPSFWDSLLKPFRLTSVEGSAVIMTTRIESIARIVQTMPLRHLDCMSNDDCWLIFKQNAFLGRDPTDMDLVQIGKRIVKKCNGLPLAVKVLARLLCNEFDHERWEDVLQSELWDVQDQHNEIIPALRLSYLQLPGYLKQCFLYACVFPKDFKFYREQLVQLWMAQGFIQCKGRKQVEDIGNMYFDELVQRSFFFRWSPGYLDETEYFGMHDLIHDLAKHYSGGVISCVGKEEGDDDDEKFFQVGEGRKVDCLCLKGVRHLSINSRGIARIEWMLQSLSYDEPRAIRSLLVLSPKRYRQKLKLPSEMMINLEFLRALDLSHSSIRKLPDSMGNLKHLRYLNLGYTYITELPQVVGMLYNLQTFNLKGCAFLKSLPEDIEGLCKLRYLNLNYCEKLRSLPEKIKDLCNLRYLQIQTGYPLSYSRGMGRLTNLRSLVGFDVARRRGSVGVNGMELLKDMVHLCGRLKICGLENVLNPEDAVIANLTNKKHIRQLYLHWNNSSLPYYGNDGDDDDKDNSWASPGIQTEVLEKLQPPNGLEVLHIINYEGVKFPSWMVDDGSSFSGLTRIKLEACHNCALLPPLGQLPSLKYLKIWHADKVERVGPEFQGGIGFPALEELIFGYLSSCVTWEAANRGDFPRLRLLQVTGCPRLKSMVPLYIFAALQVLEMEDCDALTSIELKSSSSSSSIGPPPLTRMKISTCSSARFSPEDEPLLLPPTLEQFIIDQYCPLLLEWCKRDSGGRLAHTRVYLPIEGNRHSS